MDDPGALLVDALCKPVSICTHLVVFWRPCRHALYSLCVLPTGDHSRTVQPVFCRSVAHDCDLARIHGALARSYLWHVVVLAQAAEVLVELLDLFLVCLDALLSQPFLQSLASHFIVSSLRLRLLSAPAFSYRSLGRLGR